MSNVIVAEIREDENHCSVGGENKAAKDLGQRGSTGTTCMDQFLLQTTEEM